MIIENEYQVKLSEIGKDNKVTNKAILSYLEDIGGIHSNLAGTGLLNIEETNMSWVLLEWKLQVIKRPKYTDKIKVKTWSKPPVKCYAYRDFELYDMEGNIIAKAISKWILIDISKGKILRVDDKILEKYEPEERTVFENEKFEKIKESSEYKEEVTYKVKRSDIDVNKHMHNLNYIDLATEVLPEEVYNNKTFDNVRITYKKEIKLGEVVQSKYAYQDGKHVIAIKSEDDKVLHSIIELY